MSWKALFILATLVLLLMGLAAPCLGDGSDEELLLGLIPEDNIFQQMKRHRPLAQYMTKKLGIKVRFTVLSRYPHIITRFKSRELDGAFFGIFTSVLAEEALSIEPLVRPVATDGKSTATGYIFVRTDSGISNIGDMRGKRAAFVDQVTATGYLYMLYYLRTNGIRKPGTFFSEHTFTGSNESAVYTVHSRQADVGVAKGRIVEKILERDKLIKDELRILSVSKELPDNTLFLRKSLPIQLKLRIQQVLLEMDSDPEGKKILEYFGSSKFIEAKSRDFTPVRSLARKAGINIRNFRYDY